MQEAYSILESKIPLLRQWYEENANHDMFLEEALKLNHEVNNGLQLQQKFNEKNAR